MQTYLCVASAVFFFSLISSAGEVLTETEKKPSSEAAENQEADKIGNKTEAPASTEGKAIVTPSASGSHTGEIFVIRNGIKTEVFFRNHNQSYFIPKGNKHNTQLKELQKKSKLNQPVTIEFNPKTREITQVQESKPASPAAAKTEGSSPSDGKENSK